MKTFLWALLIAFVRAARRPSVCFDRRGEFRPRLYSGGVPRIPRSPGLSASTRPRPPAQHRRGGAADGAFEALRDGLALGPGSEADGFAPDERDVDPARFQEPPEMGPEVHGAVPGDARTQAPVQRQAVKMRVDDGERLHPDRAGALAQRLPGGAEDGAAEGQDAAAVARRALGEEHDG